MGVREATAADLTAVMNVLDGAVLDIEYGRVRAAAESGQVLVAVSGDGTVARDGTDATVLGAIVLDDAHVAAIAVRRNRRGQGIGTALVEAATNRRDRLTATFDAGVRHFYERLGFTIESAAGEERYCGVWVAE